MLLLVSQSSSTGTEASTHSLDLLTGHVDLRLFAPAKPGSTVPITQSIRDHDNAMVSTSYREVAGEDRRITIGDDCTRLRNGL